MNLPPEQIEGLSLGSENFKKRKQFTKDELDSFRELHTQASMDKDDLEEQLRDTKKQFTEKIKTLKTTSKEAIKNLRMGFMEKDCTVFVVPNHESGMADLYDTHTYELVDSRRLRPEERDAAKQVTIFHNNVKSA